MIAEINQAFDEAKEIVVYFNGQTKCFEKSDLEFTQILTKWNDMLKGSHPMPALGVSLDEETKTQMKEGYWIEFDFKTQQFCYQMPFEKLLVNIKCDYSGFNVIRYNTTDGYFGRCFYLMLQSDMSEFFKYMTDNLYFKL